MQCESFEARLNEVLDARQPLSSASDLSEHIRQCAPCRALARAYEAMLLGFEQFEVPPEPAGLTLQVLSELRRPIPSVPSRPNPVPPGPRFLFFPPRGSLALAAAAVLLLAIGLPFFFNRAANLAKDDHPGGGPRASRQGTAVVAQTGQPSSGSALPSNRQPQDRSADVPAVARTSLPIAFLDPSQLKAEELISSLPATGWAHDVADGLEPVTKPTVGAINGFLQLWGVGDQGRRS